MKKWLLLINLYIGLSSCNFLPDDNNNLVNTINIEVSDTSWIKKVSFINEPSEFYSYEISFTKKDTLIMYFVDSKKRAICEPIYFKYLMIVTKDRNISIVFKNKASAIEVDTLAPLRNNINPFNVEYVSISKGTLSKESDKINAESSSVFLRERKQIADFLFSEFGWH